MVLQPLLLPQLADKYQNANPFPHVVIDNFFDIEEARKIVSEWPFNNKNGWYNKIADTSKKSSLNDPKRFGPVTHYAFHYLNSPGFLLELEGLTGIPDLLPDPSYQGGGLHEIHYGGFLKMHADFNVLEVKEPKVPEGMALVRKINLLLYLNPLWEPSWGGQLELVGPPKVEDTKIKILPKFNRCVIFNTTDDSWHGHPHPMTPPPGVTRRSIALYYYRIEPKPSVSHSTIYRDDLGAKTDFRTIIEYP